MRGRGFGAMIFIACIAAFAIYAYFLLVSEWSTLVLKLTILGLIAVIASLFGWIGLNMAIARRGEDLP